MSQTREENINLSFILPQAVPAFQLSGSHTIPFLIFRKLTLTLNKVFRINTT